MNTQLTQFLEKKSEKEKLIVIYGPTASGKTSLSIDIAKYINSEIISADSRQVYKYLDIGSGKVTNEEMEGVPHHMLDIITADEKFSVGKFKIQAGKHIEALHAQNKIPIIAGGTGLYIDSLMFDYGSGLPRDVELQKNLEAELVEKGKEYMHKKLVALDPDYAEEIHPNNSYYVIRALEVFILTGKSKKSFRTPKKLRYETLLLCPDYSSREVLYERINTRVGNMFSQGLEEEMQSLIAKGYTKNSPGMKSIGYREFFDYYDGVYDLETCKTLIQQHSRNYAKRQITRFSKYKNLIP